MTDRAVGGDLVALWEAAEASGGVTEWAAVVRHLVRLRERLDLLEPLARQACAEGLEEVLEFDSIIDSLESVTGGLLADADVEELAMMDAALADDARLLGMRDDNGEGS